MVYLVAIFIALLTAVAGAFAAGFAASLAVRWYHIPGREGASGYFIVSFGIMGIGAGIIIGIVCAFLVPPDSLMRFFEALGLSLGTMTALAGAGGVIAWQMADIPPEIDGEDLFLIVEARCPEGWMPSTAGPGDFELILGSLRFGRRIIRKNVRGPIWKDEATWVDGRWIVRGAVEVFTSRGRRFLAVVLGAKLSEGFILPLPRWPGRKYLRWSDWLPRLRRDDRPFMNRLSYRFRIQRWSEPMKVEKIGEFEAATITRSFYQIQQEGGQAFGSRDMFELGYRGQPLTIVAKPEVPAARAAPAQRERMNLLATFPGPRPAMLVNFGRAPGQSAFYLLSEADGKPKIELVADGLAGTLIDLSPDAPRVLYPSHEAPNRRDLVHAGLYRIGWNAVLDTRSLAIYRFNRPPEIGDIDRVPPLGTSPDERSFISLTLIAGNSEKPALAAIDFVADRFFIFPIERQRMNYTRPEEVTPAWVLQHFIWERAASGFDRLVKRTAC